MTASYGLALGGASSRGVPDAGDLIEQARYAEFAEAVLPMVGDSGRAESPPQPRSFTGDRRVG